MRSLAIVVFIVLLAGAAAQGQDAGGNGAAPVAPASSDDAAFDAQFVCPETLGNPDARNDELARFLEWAADHHPEWNLRKRLDVRYGLLRRHACETTLAHLAASARPPFKP